MYSLIQFLSQDYILLLVSLILIFFAVATFIYNLIPDPESIMAMKRLGVEDELPKESKILMVKLLRPIFSLLLKRTSKMKFLGDRDLIRKKLITANLSSELAADEFIAFKIVTTAMVPAIFLFMLTSIGFNVPSVMIPIFAVLGFYYPDLWMSERIKSRRREILIHLPYTIDVLTLSVEAGLDFIAALTRLIQKTKRNALTDELSQMLKEIRLGTPRSDALRNMADRLQIEEISSLATLLIQADQFGASIGPVLRAQSDQIRTNRFFAAEQAGARASQLILLPMIIFIFPTIFLVILGPFLITFSTKGFM